MALVLRPFKPGRVRGDAPALADACPQATAHPAWPLSGMSVLLRWLTTRWPPANHSCAWIVNLLFTRT